MPTRLNKILALLHGCVKIQRAWRGAKQRKPVAPSKAAIEIARAYWKGYKVRRVLEVRDLQLKVRLRHGLYSVIVDTEKELSKGDQTRRACRGGPRRDLRPWLEVLYAELRRLQLEVLDTFTVALEGRKQLWGSAREQFLWQGWSEDLRRFPMLFVARLRSDRSKAEIREFSPIDSEVSLLGSVQYQPCSPPQSPELASWMPRTLYQRSPSNSTRTSLWSDDECPNSPTMSPRNRARVVTEHRSFKTLPRFTPPLRCPSCPETGAGSSAYWEDEPEPSPDGGP